MALTAKEKRSIRRAFPKRKTSAAIITLIDSGASGAVSYRNEKVISISHGSKPKAAALIANLETGSATTGKTEKRLGRVMGRLVAETKGRADGRMVSEIVRRLLGERGG